MGLVTIRVIASAALILKRVIAQDDEVGHFIHLYAV
jgi:hypothetical protein